MAAQPRGLSFVSAAQLKSKRDAIKSHLKGQLEEEKSKEELRKLKEEKRKKSGDDRWLNPLLDERLKLEINQKKDKKQKKKKKKKSKKKDREKMENEDGDSDEWIENPVTATTTAQDTHQSKPERESWMEGDPFSSVFSRTFKNTKEDKKPKQDTLMDMPGSHPNELNPYWKKGGKGLPSTIEPGRSNIDAIDDQCNDSWIHRAYDRLKAQSVADGIQIEDAVIKKWGSMKKLQRLLDAAESQTSTDRPICTARGWNTRTKGEPSSVSATPGEVTNIETKSESEDSTEDERDLEPIQPLNEQEKNELGARLMRAEIMGDDDAAADLRKRLDAAQTAVGNPQPREKQEDSVDDTNENVLLTTKDRHGNVIPVHLDANKIDDQSNKKRKKNLIATHDDDGKRVRYFEDDDTSDIQSLIRQERLSTGDDTMSKFKKFQANQRLVGDDILDDMFESASAIKQDKSRNEKRKMNIAMSSNSKAVANLERCRFCMGSTSFEKHLLITIGKKVCLSVPSVQSLVNGHCLLFPIEHVTASTYADEDVLEELREFKQALTKLFSKEDEDVVFLENVRSVKGHQHATIECVPIARESSDTMPIYFKKALLESDSEWSQNKKVINIKGGREGGVKRAVPKGLPYFAVEFGTDGGFAHIIEDEDQFSAVFGKEVIGGILDLEPRLWRRPPRESFERHKRKVLNFIEKWKTFDISNRP